MNTKGFENTKIAVRDGQQDQNLCVTLALVNDKGWKNLFRPAGRR